MSQKYDVLIGLFRALHRGAFAQMETHYIGFKQLKALFLHLMKICNVLRLLTLLFGVAVIMSCSGSRKTARVSSSASYKSTSSSIKQSRNEVVRLAEDMQGVKYRYGGTSPRSGMDCSGLVSYVYAEHGVRLPRTSRDQSQYGSKRSLKDARPGDLLFFKSGAKVNHVAILVSNSRDKVMMVHSTSSRGVIVEDLLASSYWKPRFTFARSVL